MFGMLKRLAVGLAFIVVGGVIQVAVPAPAQSQNYECNHRCNIAGVCEFQASPTSACWQSASGCYDGGCPI